MYFSLMLGRVMLTCDSFALVGWTSTPKGGFILSKNRRTTARVWFFKWSISGKQSLCFSGIEKHEKQENRKNAGGGIIKNSKNDFSFEKYCAFHSGFVIS